MKKGSEAVREPQKLASQLDRLLELNPAELREQWQTLFGADPAPKLRSSLLVQAIAYRLQEKALGGLKPATLRLLERIADAAAARRQVATTPEKTRVGTETVLMREWHGAKHQVTVPKTDSCIAPRAFIRCRKSRERSPAVAGRVRCSSA
jgi:hypothetical protein